MNAKILINQLFIFITITFVLGVILAPIVDDLLVVGVNLFLFLGYVFIGRSKRLSIFLIGFLFFFLGNFRKNLQKKKVELLIENIATGYQSVSFLVLKKLYVSKGTAVFEVLLTTKSNQKIGALVYCPNKLGKLVSGEEYISYQKISLLKQKKAPYPDSYFRYLRSKHITHRIYLNQLPKLKKENTFSFKQWLIRNRYKTIENVQQYPWSPKVLSFFKSFILGERSGIPDDLIRVFRNTGLMHVLSISGLHIGILYLILASLFQPLLFRHKYRWFKSIFVLLMLWGYVFFISAPISAIRAASMFSLFDLSNKLYRKQHSLDILFVFIFFITLVDPLALENLGFQLSVTAVFFIIVGMHFWTRWYVPANFFCRMLWQLAGVTLCAQLGLLPLLIHYFHQFPLLFLVANIPVLGIIPIVVVFSLLVVLGCQLSFDLKLGFILYEKLISLLIDYITWVANFEGTVLRGLRMNTESLVVVYALVIVVLVQVFREKFKYWNLILCVNIFLLFTIGYTLKEKNNKELWLFEERQKLFIADRNGRELKIYTESENSLQTTYWMKYWGEITAFNSVSPMKLMNVYCLDSNRFLRIINKEFTRIEEGDVCVVLASARMNFDRFFQQKPSMVLYSSGMYRGQKERLKKICNQNKIPCWDLKEGGIDLLNL